MPWTITNPQTPDGVDTPLGGLPSGRGRHRLPRAFVIANQRDRILDAMAHEVAEMGYPNVTVADVRRRAGVSSKTFYELFADKADCFLAAYDAAIALLRERVAAVFEEMPDPTPGRTRAVLARVLELFAAEPDFARMCIVEPSAAGPEAMRRYVEVIEGFVPMLDRIETYEAAQLHGGTKPDLLTRQALIGGVVWVIYRQIVAGETEQLPALLPPLTRYLLAPFLGEQHAAAVAFGE
jgi:AcrR family transcriptional regulator